MSIMMINPILKTLFAAAHGLSAIIVNLSSLLKSPCRVRVLLAAPMVLVLALVQWGEAQASVITANFTAVVTGINGSPFGIVAQPGVTTVTGFIKYRETTAPLPSSSANTRLFNELIPDGLFISLAGVQVSSSNYLLENVNNVGNFGGSDIFQAVADDDGLNSNPSIGGDIRAGGAPALGSVQLQFFNLDQTMYPCPTASSACITVLPTIGQLLQLDGLMGFLADKGAQGGESANNLVFESNDGPVIGVSEPATLALFGLSLASLGYMRRRQTA